MKHLPPLLLLSALALLFASCEDTYQEHIVRGTLYADSTLTTPLEGKQIDFKLFENPWYYHPWDDSEGRYLGHATTDHRGRFAFQYVTPAIPDDARRMQTKHDVDPDWRTLLITCEADTLYASWADIGSENYIKVYPGCWTDPDHTTSDPQPSDPINESEENNL